VIRTTAILALVATVSAAPVAASSQLAMSVARDLKHMRLDVDVDDLTTNQLASLHTVLTGNRSQNDKRNMAKSIIGGEYSVRGVFLGDR